MPQNTHSIQILICCHKTSSVYAVTPSPLQPTGSVNVCGATAGVLWTTVLEITMSSAVTLFSLDGLRRD